MDARTPDPARGSSSPERPSVPGPALPSRPPARAFQRPASRASLLIVALALAIALAWGWRDLSTELTATRTDAAKRLSATESALAVAQTRDSDFANELRDAQAKLQLLEARLAESQSQQASLEALYRELAPSREELALAEVEQVLALASQQLALAGNVQAALAAVQLADAKLARLDRPRLLPLRRSLARDMDALKAVPYVDVAGISVKLDQVLGALDGLPLARDERLEAPPRTPPPADDPPWLRFLRDLWNDLRGVVRIEVSDRPAAALLSPQEGFFLRENVRLRLLAARLALLSRDDAAFRGNLTEAQTWVQRYFDTRVKSVQSVTATLAQVRTTQMAAEMPDLGRSLDAVRTLKASAELAAERPAQGAPTPSPRTR